MTELRLRTRRLILLALAGWATLFAALPTVPRAMEVRFSVALDHAVLQEALRARLAGPEGDATWQGDDGCHAVRVDDVTVQGADGRLRISTRGTAHAGFPIFRFCVFSVSWDGYLDTIATPVVGPDWQLRMEGATSQLLDRRHERTAVASRLWDVVKDGYDRRLRDFAFDLRPPADEARALIRSSIDPGRADVVIGALDSLRPVGTRVDDEGVKVDVVMDVPERIPPTPGATEPPLQPVELQHWQAMLESFDGFLVFVIKDLGGLSADQELREGLFEILFDSRRRLLAALAGEQSSSSDPVRDVFLAAWEQLRPVIRRAAARGELKDRGLRYATFLAAGDALTALDAVSPWLGLDVSADGLRRMARLLDPSYVGDPVAYSEAPDPTLRELFHFHDPDAPPVAPEPDEPGAWWWPSPRAAHAEVGDDLAALVRALDRVVPANDKLDTYRDTVGRLLEHVAANAYAQNRIDGRFQALYGHLVRAVAWQESCWRQFVRKNGKVTYLLSSTGDVGIMQVNRRVWRGFFDVEKLKWNVGYNAGAGAEILAQLLERVGIRESEEHVDNAARATYSAYNGGPAAYRRYRDARVPRALRAVDEAFWQKYQATAAGKALDYVLCVEKWGGAGARLSTVPAPSGDVRCRSSRSSLATRMSPSRHAAIASRPRASCV